MFWRGRSQAGSNSQRGTFPAHAVGLCDVEERSDGDFSTAIVETGGVLAVGIGGVIVRIETTEAVKDGTAIFTKFRDQGEGDGHPIRVSGRDVDVGGFDSIHDREDRRVNPHTHRGGDWTTRRR